MVTISRFAACILVLVIAPCRPAIGQQPQGDGWVLVATRNLAPDIGRDFVELRYLPKGYKAVRFAVPSGHVRLTRIALTYRSGIVHVDDRIMDLRPGQRSDSIGAANQSQPIEKIGLRYTPQPGTRQAIALQIWGQIAAPSATEVLVGTQVTTTFAVDRGRPIPVDASLPSFDQVKVLASKGDVHVQNLKVHYSNQPSVVIPVDEVIKQDTASPWIGVPAGGKVEQIELVYKVRPGFSKPGQVAVYASPVASKPPGDCATNGLCTPVPVFFGTNRQRQDGADRIHFTSDRTNSLVLGRAIVTVPRALRKIGEIPTPLSSVWDALQSIWNLRNPWKDDPSRHFTLPPGGVTVYGNTEEYVAAIRRYAGETADFRDHVVMFVHGYNTSFDNALFRVAQIAYDLGSEDVPFGVPVLYSWPSAGHTEDYVYDLESSRLAIAAFKSFLDTVVNKTGAKHVHIIAHSMGNFPTMHVLNSLAGEESWKGKIEQIIAAAPDVDAEEFKTLATSASALGRAVTLYASRNDRAMKAARIIRKNYARAGDIAEAGPVVVPGVDTIDVSNVSTDIFALNHSTYAEKREILNDMWRLMRTGERPPDLRSISIKPRKVGGTTHWRFVE